MRCAAAAALACLTIGAPGALAQTGAAAPKTTNTYDAGSTSEDIRISCKDFEIGAQVSVSPQVLVKAKCNKALGSGAVGAAATTIDMLDYANCQAQGGGSRVKWGPASGNARLVGALILLTSTGGSYVFGGYCLESDGTQTGPSGVDIGDTTDGLKNDAGSLAKR